MGLRQNWELWFLVLYKVFLYLSKETLIGVKEQFRVHMPFKTLYQSESLSPFAVHRHWYPSVWTTLV